MIINWNVMEISKVDYFLTVLKFCFFFQLVGVTIDKVTVKLASVQLSQRSVLIIRAVPFYILWGSCSYNTQLK